MRRTGEEEGEKEGEKEGLKVRKVWMRESRKREKEMNGWRG